MRWYNNQPVIFLDGIEDRTQAETLVKAILIVQQDLDQTPTEPDAWYDQQLVGLKVFRDGKQIGTVARVEHLPAQDLLVVDYNQTEVMVPFVKQLVPEVDISQGKVTITPPLGLFEEIGED